MTARRKTFALVIAVTLWLASTAATTASDELNRAKELYSSASYDEALMVLDGLNLPPGSAEAVEAHQYRVFCLVALDRKDEAAKAMAALVTAAPQFQLSENMASPRVRSLFTEVRKSLLPGIIQRAYADAKSAFDRRDSTAAAQFERVLTLLKDGDVAGNAALADLSTVATGFYDLSKVLAAPAPAAPTSASAPATASTNTARVPPPVTATRNPPAPSPRTTPAASPARTAAAPSTASETSGAGAEPAAANVATIVPPVAISQTLPLPQMRDRREWDGEVEVVINASGKVVSARMTKPIHPLYDTQLLRAAREWTYKPALKDGVPTQMVKLVAVHLDSRPACSSRVNVGCRPAGGN